RSLAALLEDIADGDDARVLLAKEEAEVPVDAVIADADGAHRDALARAPRAEEAARRDRGKADPRHGDGAGTTEEASSRERGGRGGRGFLGGVLLWSCGRRSGESAHGELSLSGRVHSESFEGGPAHGR